MHSLHVTHGATSDVGLTRAHNEDRFHADPSAGLFLVCDGMGGHRAGEVASSRVIDIIPRHLAEAEADPSLPLIGATRPEFSSATNRLASAVRLANHKVHQEAARHAEYTGMGTTVVAAWLVGPILSIAHVGDSRFSTDPVLSIRGAPDGTQLPVVPKFKRNLTGRYRFQVGAYDAHLQATFIYQDETRSALVPFDEQVLGTNDAYGLPDFSAGFGNERYNLALFVNNAFDKRADITRFAQCREEVCSSPYIVTNQPRTIGVKFGQKF